MHLVELEPVGTIGRWQHDRARAGGAAVCRRRALSRHPPSRSRTCPPSSLLSVHSWSLRSAACICCTPSTAPSCCRATRRCSRRCRRCRRRSRGRRRCGGHGSGFNASHSTGAMLFGLVYGYLALRQPALLFGSWFLCAVGLIHLLGYVWIGSRYWFSVPFHAIVAATALYCLGLVVRFA